MMTRKTLMPGVMLTSVQTDKFKTNCLSLNLLTQLRQEHAALNAVLPHVLRRGTAKHPDMESILNQLDDYYGARLEPIVRKKGEIQALGFYADFADDAFIPNDELLLEKIADLLGELLLSPGMEESQLRAVYVNSEREKLLEQIRSRINDKRSYAQERLVELMCFGEDYAVSRLGRESEAEGIDSTALTKRHQRLIECSPIEIFYCGSADSSRVEEALMNALASLPRGSLDTDIGTDIRINAVESKPRYYTEELDVTQGKLSLGFRLGEYGFDADQSVLRVMNAVFGGSVTSKLFMNVREKLSLAYYASSSADIFKRILTVASGIEFDKYQQTLDEVFAQLRHMCDGEITAEELEASVSYISSGFRTVSDSPGSLEDFFLSQNMSGSSETPEDAAKAVEAVTKDDIVELTRAAECDAVYFLRGPEE